MTRKIWMSGAIVMAAVSVASGDLFIESLPPDAPQGFDAFFTKYVDVLGVGVYATSDTQDVKVLRCANVLAQYLDNDEDGKPDNPSVHARMVAGEAGMVMWPTFDDFENSGFFESVPESSIRNKQDCMGEETIPNWQDIQQFDASLEECFHLVNYVGFSGEYPQVFGEDPGSDVADAMDVNIANGYFHYNDPTCDYQCKLIEYTYWAMTSMLGAQEAPWRAAEIANEWELPTRALVEQNDPLIFAILNDPMWGLPTVLPDGNYDGSPGKGSCPGDLNGDGVVDSADLGLLLVAWDTADSAADLDGSGVVGGSDLGLFLLAWGACPTDPCAGNPCDDGDPCTIDICNPTTGTCTNEQIPGCGGGDDVCGGNNPWPCTESA